MDTLEIAEMIPLPLSLPPDMRNSCGHLTNAHVYQWDNVGNNSDTAGNNSDMHLAGITIEFTAADPEPRPASITGGEQIPPASSHEAVSHQAKWQTGGTFASGFKSNISNLLARTASGGRNLILQPKQTANARSRAYICYVAV